MTDNKQITIDYLKNHPEQVITCAQWSFHQWGHYTPDRTLQQFIDARHEYLNDTAPPLTLVTFDGSIPVGMCSLVATREVEPQLSPWLAALYVVPEYRNQSIGSMLEMHICKKARTMGYDTMYCFTSEFAVIPWYEKRNWKIRNTKTYLNHLVTVMEKSLQ